MPRLWLFFLLVFGVAAFAQNDAPPITTGIATFPVFTLNAAPVSGASLQVVGASGQQNYCYWAVANYPIGAVESSLGCIPNAPNTLSGGNYVSISPYDYPPGV